MRHEIAGVVKNGVVEALPRSNVVFPSQIKEAQLFEILHGVIVIGIRGPRSGIRGPGSGIRGRGSVVRGVGDPTHPGSRITDPDSIQLPTVPSESTGANIAVATRPPIPRS